MDKLVMETQVETKKQVETEKKVETQKESAPVEKKEKIVLHKSSIKEHQIKVQSKVTSNPNEGISTEYFVQPQTEEVKKEEKTEEKTEEITPYVASFENVTIEQLKMQQAQTEEELAKEEAKKIKEAALELEKQELEKEVEEEVTEEETSEVKDEVLSENEKEVTTLVIEKPNYDLMPKAKKKPKMKFKFKAVALAISVMLCGIGCATGSVLIDNMSSQYIELQDQYEINLWKYLKHIEQLNATDKTLDFVETYPDDINDASSVGENTNWFNELTEFLSGIFGG